MAILSFAYTTTFAMTANEMLAGSVTVGMATFSAIMYVSPIIKNMAFTVVLIPDFTVKSAEEKSALSVEELEVYLENKKRFESATLKAEIQTQIADAIKENVDSTTLKALEAKMNTLIEENDHVMLEMKSMNEKMKTESPVGLKALLIEKANDLKALVVKGAGKLSMDIEMKASQVPSDIGNRTDFAQMLGGVSAIPHKRTYLKDRIRVVPTNREYVKYTDQATVVRDAQNVAQCAPMTSTTKLTWTTLDLQTKKVKDFVDICIDMLEDYDFVDGEIRNLLETSVQLKADNGLLLDDGLGANLNGIASYASTFSAINPVANYSLQVPTPTLIDLIVVMGAQIMALGEENFFMADTAYVNPKDYTLMKLLKDQNDNYIGGGSVDPRIFQDVNGRLWIDGTILVIPNPLVPADEAYVFDSMRATIYQRKTATVEFSYENNDNFENDVVTVKVYERLNLLVKNNDANAFMHAPSIAGAITAITKP